MLGKIKIIENDTNNNLIINDLISSLETIKLAREKGFKNNLTIEIYINENKNDIYTTFNINKKDEITCVIFPQVFDEMNHKKNQL